MDTGWDSASHGRNMQLLIISTKISKIFNDFHEVYDKWWCLVNFLTQKLISLLFENKFLNLESRK